MFQMTPGAVFETFGAIIERLKLELLSSPNTHQFTFSRNELMDLLGVGLVLVSNNSANLKPILFGQDPSWAPEIALAAALEEYILARPSRILSKEQFTRLNTEALRMVVGLTDTGPTV